MTTTTFEMTGLEGLGELTERFGVEVQKQVDLASKNGINKAADLITYGRTSNIKASTVSSKSVVAMAAKALRIPKEHIFYRTFTKGIKVSVGRGRGAKPYASVMFRGNSINVVDLLLSGNEAKAMYGFTTRRKSIHNKRRPNMKAHAAKARVGGRRSGKVRIAGRVYGNSYIEDGSFRASSSKVDKYYREKLGAKPFRLEGDRFLLIQRKNAGQKLPYPSKVVKIDKFKVLRALDAAAAYGVKSNSNKIIEMQNIEVNKKLKKLGFTLQ